MPKAIPIIDGKRVCSSCKVPVLIENYQAFYKADGRVFYQYCNICANKGYPGNRGKPRSTWKKDLIKSKKDYVSNIKENTPCKDCGLKFDPVCMDFDHISDDKKDGVALMIVRSYSLQVLKDEIDKCELVCSNCHRIRTRDRGRSDKTRMIISKGLGGRPIIDNYGNIYKTAEEASRKLDIASSSISQVLHNKRSSTRGYTFKYVEKDKAA